MQAAVAHSADPQTHTALEEIIDDLEQGLTDAVPVAGLIYASIEHDLPALLSGLKARWPAVRFIGCSSDGEGSSVAGFQEDSICVVLLAGEFSVRAGVGQHANSHTAAAAKAAVKMARQGERGHAESSSDVPSSEVPSSEVPSSDVPSSGQHDEAVFCLAFTESVSASACALTVALTEVLGPSVPIFGAAAGDDLKFEKTFQFLDGEVHSDALVVMIFSGPIAIGASVGSGFCPTGPLARVTRAEANVVFEVDGEPALRHYRDYLGDLATPSSEFPLAIVEEDRPDKVLAIRAPLHGDAMTGAITFAGDVPAGNVLRFAEAGGREGGVGGGARLHCDGARAPARTHRSGPVFQL